MQTNVYDSIVIGAGMSGLAAAIRLAMFDKNVLVLEKHIIPGGLNSYYQRGKRQFDVGLHALTNFAKKEEKNKPLGKLLKQLRIKHEELKLKEQSFSLIQFPHKTIQFNNDFNQFLNQIEIHFPEDYQDFLNLVQLINDFNEVSLSNKDESARSKLSSILKNVDLIEMILAPLLIYGSAWENDMDFSQFVIMFKSIYMEGFARPDGGVRTIIDLLMNKYKALNGKIQFKTGVSKIEKFSEHFKVTLESGEELFCKKVFSSMGYPETMNIVEGSVASQLKSNLEIGKLTFCESIFVTRNKMDKSNTEATIIFYNDQAKYHYQQAEDYFDDRSAVLCFTDNFNNSDYSSEGIVRVTFMANYELWKNLKDSSNAFYLKKKEEVAEASLKILKKAIPHLELDIVFKDVFTPTTITRYTSHFQGTVYGSTTKTRNGKTSIPGLYIIGTDQGFLGIVGSMLSGISMANLYGLMEGDNHAL
ncbi:MAG: phytoene desaturase family protein [Bacteriovoracaceae bacterium]